MGVIQRIREIWGMPRNVEAEEVQEGEISQSVSRATRSQTHADRVLSYELYQIYQGKVRELTEERFLLHHTGRRNVANMLKWYVNLVRKYCMIMSVLYVREPDRIFGRYDKSGNFVEVDESESKRYKEILKQMRWSVVMQEAEKMMHLQRSVVLAPYIRTDYTMGLKYILRHEVGVDMDEEEPGDIDRARLVWVLGGVDTDGRAKWYQVWTQTQFFYFSPGYDGPSRIMEKSPTGEEYEKINPYGIIPFEVINESEPYQHIFCPVFEELHEIQLNFSSLMTDIAHSLLWSCFGFIHAKGWSQSELPDVLGPGVIVQSENPGAQLSYEAPPDTFSAAMSAAVQLLRLWAVMQGFPPNMITRDVHERTSDAILAARMDLQEVRERQMPRWVEAEARLWRKVRKMINNVANATNMMENIPEDVELKVVHRMLEPLANPQSEAQAIATRINAGVSTPEEEREKMGLEKPKEEKENE